MLSLLRVASLVKLLVAEFIAILCLATASGWFVSTRGGLGCPPSGSPLTGTFYGSVLIGLLLAAWVVYRTAWPDEVRESWRPVLKAGPVIVQNPTIPDVDYSFATTHPSYALLDLIQLGPALLFRMVGGAPPDIAGCGSVSSYVLGNAAVALALFFPIFRLFSWYVLGRITTQAARRGAWKPVALLCGVLVPVTGIIPAGVYLPKLRAPVVDATTLSGGLAAHPEFSGKQVRLHGVIRRPAVRCGCSDQDPNACHAGALLVDLGAGGEVVVHTTAEWIGTLVQEGRRPAGSPYGAYGTLKPQPRPVPPDYDRVDCGFDQFGPPPPAGRAFLELQ